MREGRMIAAEHRPVGKLLLHGIIGGIVAGIIFAMVEMFMNLAQGEPFLGPVRMISTMVLGTEAMEPTYPLATSLVVGMAVHMGLSMLYGMVFAGLLGIVRQVRASAGLLLAYGSLFGFALWVVNFLIIAPFLFPQFTQVNQIWNGFVAHTFFFGTVLGAYVAMVRPWGRAAAEVAPEEAWAEEEARRRAA